MSGRTENIYGDFLGILNAPRSESPRHQRHDGDDALRGMRSLSQFRAARLRTLTWRHGPIGNPDPAQSKHIFDHCYFMTTAMMRKVFIAYPLLPLRHECLPDSRSRRLDRWCRPDPSSLDPKPAPLRCHRHTDR